MDGFDVAAWLGLLPQGTRFITPDTPAADGLILERLEGREAVNDDFRFTLDCLSASAFLDLKSLVGAATQGEVLPQHKGHPVRWVLAEH